MWVKSKQTGQLVEINNSPVPVPVPKVPSLPKGKKVSK